jgi:hypothetical protein
VDCSQSLNATRESGREQRYLPFVAPRLQGNQKLSITHATPVAAKGRHLCKFPAFDRGPALYLRVEYRDISWVSICLKMDQIKSGIMICVNVTTGWNYAVEE